METDEKINDGKMFANLRNFIGIKQEVLAREVGVKRQRISKLETTKNIPLPTQKKLVDAMLKKVEEIIAEEEGGGHRRLPLKKRVQRKAKQTIKKHRL